MGCERKQAFLPLLASSGRHYCSLVDTHYCSFACRYYQCTASSTSEVVVFDRAAGAAVSACQTTLTTSCWYTEKHRNLSTCLDATDQSVCWSIKHAHTEMATCVWLLGLHFCLMYHCVQLASSISFQIALPPWHWRYQTSVHDDAIAREVGMPGEQ